MSKPIIKPGQEWLGKDGNLREVIAIYKTFVIFEKLCDAVPGVACPDMSVPDCLDWWSLITSHDGADLEAARAEGWEVIVDGIEEPVWGEVEKIEQYNQGNWCYPTCGAKKLDDGVTMYDLDPEHTYRYKLKAEQPQYKLFEIQWKTRPQVKRESGLILYVMDFPLIDDYRIFGFTDDEDDTFEGGYYTNPCDNKGNRRFAIGRFEG